jgi:hypothetical protein
VSRLRDRVACAHEYRGVAALRTATIEPALSGAEAIEPYSWRWPIDPFDATGKQVTGAAMPATAP